MQFEEIMRSHARLPEFAGTLRFRREVVEEDLARVRAMVRASGFFSKEEEEIAVELVQERLDKGAESGYAFLVAEDEAGRLLGYTCHGRIPGTRSSHEVYWIVVDRRLRGRKIGKALMAQTERDIRAHGGTRVYLDTSSRVQYTPTRAFYLACGYAMEAVLRDFYQPGENKVTFVKALAPAEPRGPRLIG